MEKYPIPPIQGRRGRSAGGGGGGDNEESDAVAVDEKLAPSLVEAPLVEAPLAGGELVVAGAPLG